MQAWILWQRIRKSVEKWTTCPPGYRRWRVRFGASGYVLLYRVFSDSIVILSVKHGLERDFPGIAAIREQTTNPD